MKPLIHNSKSGEQVCLRKKGDTYFITKVGIGAFSQTKKEKDAKKLYHQWCKEEDQVAKQDEKEGEQPSASFTSSDWTKAMDEEIIKHDNKIGFLFGKNNLGKSLKAAMSEINSDEELKNDILSQLS